MEEVNLSSPKEIKRILNEFCLHPHKKWGQNFLVDGNILKKIINEINLSEDDLIVEIGPGLGALTLPMVKRAASVLAIEIDRGLVAFLNTLLASYDNKMIMEGDVRKLDLQGVCEETWGKKEVKFVANLPYYITSPFIYSLIGGDDYWKKTVLMMQKEVAQRLMAPAGSPLYGALSVICQLYTCSRLAFTVSPKVFYPSPKVESAVIVLEPKETNSGVADKNLFMQFVSGIFRHRRKTLLNSLSHNFAWDRSAIHKLLKEAGTDPGIRPELLSAAEFANLCRLFYNK